MITLPRSFVIASNYSRIRPDLSFAFGDVFVGVERTSFRTTRGSVNDPSETSVGQQFCVPRTGRAAHACGEFSSSSIRNGLSGDTSFSGAMQTEVDRALGLYEVEAKANEIAASLSLLVEHGEASGLHDGHCPLCAALRTQSEFGAGIDLARKRIHSVPVENQIRTYWWCSPPRIGRPRIRPARSTARENGASFSNDRCVRAPL
jgi:hypothetical protein